MRQDDSMWESARPVLLVQTSPEVTAYIQERLHDVEVVIAGANGSATSELRRPWAAVVVQLVGARQQAQRMMDQVVRFFPGRRIVAVGSDARTLLDASRSGAASTWFVDELEELVSAIQGGAGDDSTPWKRRPTLAPSHLEALGRLAGGVAHDFNNILTVIETCSTFSLEQVEPGSEVAADLEMIRDAGRRAADLTRRLLIFSRRGADKNDDHARYNVLNTSTHETLVLVQRVIGSDITLEVLLGDDVHSVRMGIGSLSQMLMNLVVNARDAMPSGGLLTVSTRIEHLKFRSQFTTDILGAGEYCVLSVEDTGIGIPPENISSIFTPYFSTKGPELGTGLGLASTYGLVRGCDGAIEVTSEVGNGTKMEVYLPHFRRSPGPVTRQPREVPTGTATVLVVEDHEVLRVVTARLLVKHGYTVLEAANGQDAVYLLEERSEEIDAIVTDVVMPVMDGPELARQVRLRWPTIPLMFVSAYSERSSPKVHQRVPPGAVVVAKPFKPGTVLRALHQLLTATESTPPWEDSQGIL